MYTYYTQKMLLEIWCCLGGCNRGANHQVGLSRLFNLLKL